jgi:hypothetical protein
VACWRLAQPLLLLLLLRLVQHCRLLLVPPMRLAPPLLLLPCWLRGGLHLRRLHLLPRRRLLAARWLLLGT